MKKIVCGILAGLTMLATSTLAMAEDKLNIVTIVSTADVQTQGMAMVLSLQSKQKGANVRILLCDSAADMALKDAPEAKKLAPMNVTPGMLLQKAIKSGIPAEVCALYLPNKGVGADALIEGVGVAKPPVMAGHLTAANTRLMTF